MWILSSPQYLQMPSSIRPRSVSPRYPWDMLDHLFPLSTQFSLLADYFSSLWLFLLSTFQNAIRNNLHIYHLVYWSAALSFIPYHNANPGSIESFKSLVKHFKHIKYVMAHNSVLVDIFDGCRIAEPILLQRTWKKLPFLTQFWRTVGWKEQNWQGHRLESYKHNFLKRLFT